VFDGKRPVVSDTWCCGNGRGSIGGEIGPIAKKQCHTLLSSLEFFKRVLSRDEKVTSNVFCLMRHQKPVS